RSRNESRAGQVRSYVGQGGGWMDFCECRDVDDRVAPAAPNPASEGGRPGLKSEIWKFNFMRRILIATSNPGKLRDFAGAAAPHGIEIAGIPNFASLPSVIEDGITFEAN